MDSRNRALAAWRFCPNPQRFLEVSANGLLGLAADEGQGDASGSPLGMAYGGQGLISLVGRRLGLRQAPGIQICFRQGTLGEGDRQLIAGRIFEGEAQRFRSVLQSFRPSPSFLPNRSALPDIVFSEIATHSFQIRDYTRSLGGTAFRTKDIGQTQPELRGQTHGPAKLQQSNAVGDQDERPIVAAGCGSR